MSPGASAAAAPGATVALPPVKPRAWTHADVMALSAERDAWAAYADLCWRLGYQAGAMAEGGCPGHTTAMLDAYAAGQYAAASEPDSFHLGWEACWRRFAAEIGTRVLPRGRRRERAQAGAKAKRAREAWQAGWAERVAACRASYDKRARP